MDFSNWFKELGIKEGDILLLGSDVLTLAWNLREKEIKFNTETFIRSLMECIGDEGTLMFPTFNWDFCNKAFFDYHHTPSATGALSTTALNMNEFVRTKHPIYSFAVSGKFRNQLLELNNISAFGEDSPFAFLHKNKGKMLMIGVEYQNSFTFAHYVEQQEKVLYRFEKEFVGEYIDESGKSSNKMYSMNVRDLEKKVQTQLTPIGKEIDQLSNTIIKYFYDVRFRLLHLDEVYRVIADDIAENAGGKLHVEL